MLVKEKSLHKLSQLEEYKKYKIIKIDKFEAKLDGNQALRLFKILCQRI